MMRTCVRIARCSAGSRLCSNDQLKRPGDIDWRAGELLVRGKANREELLPLPLDVGEAIVAYLHCRPGEVSDTLFVRASA